MEHSISYQLREIVLSLLLGVGLGVVYDMLRPPRRGMGGVTGVCLDVAFCITAGGGLFCIAMSSGSGRLGTWELAAALAGFLSYMHTLSPVLLCIFTYLYRAAENAWFRMILAVKKVLKLIKFIFKNQIKCIIMKTQKSTPETADSP